MKKIILIIAIAFTVMTANAKTLIAYYSYTNNIEHIVNELGKQIETDIVEIEPTEKGLDYAANNYAIGSTQISAIRNNPNDASSYPAIDKINIDLNNYDTVIIAAPLWWSNMAAPMQTFLFHNGKYMAGKNIGLIVSSASSAIYGVEADAKRLVPEGNFLLPSLWIRSSQTSNAKTMIENWLNAIDYNNLTAEITEITNGSENRYTVYSLSGVKLLANAESTESLSSGIYIINGKKVKVERR